MLEKLLASPFTREDRKICITPVAEYAKALSDRSLPCIYMEDTEEGEPTPVFGVDLVFARTGGMEEPEEELLLRTWQRHYQLPWTIAETERLLIRETTMEDLPGLLDLYQEEEKNPDVKPFSKNPGKELEAYIRERYGFYGYGLWSVVEKSSGILVGRVGLEEELAYLIGSRFRRKGYATEAVEAVLKYGAQELELEAIRLTTSQGNSGSQRLAERLGFRKTSQKNGKIMYQKFSNYS